MRKALWFLPFLLVLILPWTERKAEAQSSSPTATPKPSLVSITSPLPGQALQGIVPIMGNTIVEGFLSAELSFAYLNNPTDTWFLIQENVQPVAFEQLAQWDTTTISDGDYSLRLVVTLSDGQQIDYTVTGVRVRNYSPIETDTPQPISVTPSPTGLSRVTITALPTITPLPTNEAQISNRALVSSIGKGALATLGLFVFLGIYQILRSLARKKAQ